MDWGDDSVDGEKWTLSSKIQEVQVTGLAEGLGVRSQSCHREQFRGLPSLSLGHQVRLSPGTWSLGSHFLTLPPLLLVPQGRD